MYLYRGRVLGRNYDLRNDNAKIIYIVNNKNNSSSSRSSSSNRMVLDKGTRTTQILVAVER